MIVLGELLCCVAAGYSLLALVAIIKRPAHHRTVPPRRPATTLLKPLCGDEPRLYECLSSFCHQDYPVFQIVFGVQDPTDPARAVVERLQREFPDIDMTLVVDETSHGSNRKVSNLINMMPAARHDCLVLSDSDIRVDPDYLRRIVPPLLQPATGTVTCLYRAHPLPNLTSRLGSLFIDTWFFPTVRIGQLFGNKRFSSGATIAIRRETLDTIGGFAAVANHLADDYLLSALPRKLGLNTVVSDHIVETVSHEPDLSAMARHEIRWLRTIRALEPVGYNFLCITLSLPWALIGALLARSSVALSAFAIALLAQIAVQVAQNRSAGRAPQANLWLLPVRSIMNVYIWCCGFLHTSVDWRGYRYDIASNGAMTKRSRKE